MRVRFGNATKDVSLLEVTPENYIVPKGEENTYHCRIEQRQFDASTGRRLSVPRIQKFDAKMFPMLQRTLKQQGWTVEILYDPTDYNREQEAEEQERRELTLKQRKELEEQRKRQEREKMKAEILAELKEAGVIAKETKKPKAAGGK